MEEKYQLKEGCLTIQMPKELDHHEAGRLKMEADFLIGRCKGDRGRDKGRGKVRA